MRHFLIALFLACSVLRAGPQQQVLAGSYTGAAGGSPSLIAHTSDANLNDVTTGAINTTGSNLIVLAVSWFNLCGLSPTISDSKGNTYTQLTPLTINGNQHGALYYCFNPTIGSGHTFTSAGLLANTICVAAFNGIATSPFDQENGNTDTAATIATGSITPSQAHSLVVSGLSFNDNSAGAVSINSGFTITDTEPQASGVNFGASLAYKVLSSSSATNPTWDVTNSTTLVGVIANFKY